VIPPYTRPVLAELEESATLATPQERSAIVPLVGDTVPTEAIVEDADSTVEVVSSPVGMGVPVHWVLLADTVPPLPLPVEKQLTDPEVVDSICTVPAENLLALLMS